ncbi:MAG: hypothetical protein M1839_005497 [Geoglossum umbratile]|nr:MAG: hypothetical protein M1839_005497 [Geoglossum umbratile]
MAFRLVANPAVRARPFPSPRHLSRLRLCISSRPYSESRYDEVLKSEIRKNWKGWTKAAAAGGLALVGYVTRDLWITDRYREYQRRSHQSDRDSAIYEALKRGPSFSELVQDTLPRDALVSEAKKLITPAKKSRGYSLVIGEHGTGKTSLIQLTVNSLKKPKGIVYVMIPNTDEVNMNPTIVIDAVKKALGWSSDLVLDSRNTSTHIFEVLDTFSRVALRYRKAHQAIPVLIIDNANRLPQLLLAQIQDFAKEASDSDIATVIFISSEGRIPRRMRERSAWSRVQRVFEIGDVSRDEALQYLRLQDIDDKTAAQIYELVGGRMILLKSTARNIQTGVRIDDLRRSLLNEAKGQLKAAKMLPGGEFHKQEKAIIGKLLKENDISDDTYWAIAGDEIGEKMLQGNVFSHHFDADNITFQSTLMKRYCELHSTLWEG